MADIFISYSKEDPQPTRDVADYLKSKDYSVWWDTDLTPGEIFGDVIRHELNAAKAVIVIWTSHSVNSKWVIAEAQRADMADKLITLRTKDVDVLRDVPMPFTVRHTDIVDNREAILAAVRRTVSSATGVRAAEALAHNKPATPGRAEANEPSGQRSERPNTKQQSRRAPVGGFQSLGDSKMVAVREPVLNTIPIAELRPTQITVGMREVHAKQKSWQQQDATKKAVFLGRHMIPVIRGPKDRLYVLDHHHLSLALHNEGVENVLVSAVVDLRTLSKDEFWVYLDNRCWVHPYDDSGRRRDFDDVPKKISALKDDPFRSVAGELRRMGGFAKDTTPFSEFLWADFMRRRINRSLAEDDFEKAMKQAMKLAKSEEASYLPGWCGPHVDHYFNHR